MLMCRLSWVGLLSRHSVLQQCAQEATLPIIMRRPAQASQSSDLPRYTVGMHLIRPHEAGNRHDPTSGHSVIVGTIQHLAVDDRHVSTRDFKYNDQTASHTAVPADTSQQSVDCNNTHSNPILRGPRTPSRSVRSHTPQSTKPLFSCYVSPAVLKHVLSMVGAGA